MAITGGMLGAAHTTSTADDFVPELWSDGIIDILAEEQFSKI